jgi:2-dehydro-3-deoxygluconokinase
MARLAELGGVEALAGTDLVFLSGISLAILRPEDRRRALDMMAGLKGRIGRLAFDPNVRPALWTGADDARSSLETACGLADVVLASTSDAEWIWNEADPERQIDLIMNLGCPEVVITLGEHGVRLRWEGGGHGAPSLAGVVSDTSGAGDSFNAAYLAARGDGAAPETAAELGQKLAARVVAHHGALIAAEYSHPSLASVAGDPI